MRIPVHRHVADLAGSSLVLIGLLLAAMAISAVPVLVQGLARHGPPPSHSARAPGLSAPDLNVSRRATS